MKPILSSLRRPGVFLAVALLVTGLQVSPIGVHTAQASLGTCWSCRAYGPILNLSNGARLNTGVVINDQRGDIQAISYTIHLPSNVTVKSMSYQGSLQVDQSAQVVADETSSTRYAVVTNVTTGATATVYAFTQVSNTCDCTYSGNNTGSSNVDVVTSVDATATTGDSTDQ